jgi:hypothetical protein
MGSRFQRDEQPAPSSESQNRDPDRIDPVNPFMARHRSRSRRESRSEQKSSQCHIKSPQMCGESASKAKGVQDWSDNSDEEDNSPKLKFESLRVSFEQLLNHLSHFPLTLQT